MNFTPRKSFVRTPPKKYSSLYPSDNPSPFITRKPVLANKRREFYQTVGAVAAGAGLGLGALGAISIIRRFKAARELNQFAPVVKVGKTTEEILQELAPTMRYRAMQKLNVVRRTTKGIVARAIINSPDEIAIHIKVLTDEFGKAAVEMAARNTEVVIKNVGHSTVEYLGDRLRFVISQQDSWAPKMFNVYFQTTKVPFFILGRPYSPGMIERWSAQLEHMKSPAYRAEQLSRKAAIWPGRFPGQLQQRDIEKYIKQGTLREENTASIYRGMVKETPKEVPNTVTAIRKLAQKGTIETARMGASRWRGGFIPTTGEGKTYYETLKWLLSPRASLTDRKIAQEIIYANRIRNPEFRAYAYAYAARTAESPTLLQQMMETFNRSI